MGYLSSFFNVRGAWRHGLIYDVYSPSDATITWGVNSRKEALILQKRIEERIKAVVIELNGKLLLDEAMGNVNNIPYSEPYKRISKEFLENLPEFTFHYQ